MVPVARLGKQLIVKTPNKVGTLAAVSNTMAAEGINILCLGAVEQGNEGHFWIVTDNNTTGAERLKSKGYTVQEKDVVLVEIGSEAGTLAPVAKVIGDCPINVHNCFFTTPKGSGNVLIVLTTENNPKAVQVIQKECQHLEAVPTNMKQKSGRTRSHG